MSEVAAWGESDTLFGAAPVIAALAAGRRDMLALFVQEEGADDVAAAAETAVLREAMGKKKRHHLNAGSSSRKQEQARATERIARAMALAEERQVPVLLRSKARLNEIMALNAGGAHSSDRHQGLLLLAHSLRMQRMSALPEADAAAPVLWLALDEVHDPQNLGAILRTACFLGLGAGGNGSDGEGASGGSGGVLLSAKNSASLSATVARASAGAAEVLEVHAAHQLPSLLGEARERGWRVLGAAGAASASAGRAGVVTPPVLPVSDVHLDMPTVLVLGNEGFGLRTNVRRQCDAFISIEAPAGTASHAEVAGVDSLNVSAAASILLHQLLVARR